MSISSIGPGQGATYSSVKCRLISKTHLQMSGHTEKVIKTLALAYKTQAHALIAIGIVQTRGVCYVTDLVL